MNASYTYSDFRYGHYELDGQNLNGNDLPAIPRHLASLGLTFQCQNKLFIQLTSTYRGELFADDFNATKIEEALITDLSASYPLRIANNTFTMLGGVNNLFNSSYFDNVRINAFSGRFYEPAPQINFYAGLRVRI